MKTNLLSQCRRFSRLSIHLNRHIWIWRDNDGQVHGTIACRRPFPPIGVVSGKLFTKLAS